MLGAAEAIALLKRSVKLNAGEAGSQHDLGIALTAAGRLTQAIEPITAAIRLAGSIGPEGKRRPREAPNTRRPAPSSRLIRIAVSARAYCAIKATLQGHGYYYPNV